MLSEFDLIKRYFAHHSAPDEQLALGVGDDCALLNLTPGMQLAVSSDMLVSGRHFFADADPTLLGHKCLAVNLSDLAAMGARPVGFTLAFSLPSAEPDWLAAFAQGLLSLADQHRCRLIGGDTTKGPLNICLTVFGELPPGSALRRDAARDDDDIWVSGTLGDARLALAGYLHELALSPADLHLAAPRMHAPTPRVALGLALRGIAHAAVDISDGLAGDLGHILERSHCGATLFIDALPAGPALQQQDRAIRRRFTLSGGDDYELCFTAPSSQRAAVLAAGLHSATAVTRIGRIEAQPGLRLLDTNMKTVSLRLESFDHFNSP
ncbi:MULTISPECIES: thiamine-phosphate kinase [unclassified Undibacterium]|uniref:thiamine-phosphate kinase n=1 Tax=unclassified Undibacterium TaxID=2630295 RepID=UPI002AC9253E|nr:MULTISPECIES: thiamine-phosphate kinase [unclassified Undibacterium]MEB0138194.1 thiamine-phosphate kinase [Undibacterium sp. CCC2.1]MEB0171051.1 thiamine-phosphate kinase [Undibacterium sp. CCC1.1]MEB0175096.1 thiamine-phosphate kinase [Undibacterium sp. CCC3.4]MEB0214320.1 thiamine-phosphate kinase [Undibacterium sp. 5I2]WPX41901.1 thiamine-phosphate kinase [Undibacterium sp. CCC3.4]